MAFERPVVCPILVGRAAQIDVLRRLLDEVQAGEGRTGLIAGEAGIGKSRLVAEATSTARRQGYLVLQGNCFQYDRALPYAPVLDMFRSWLAALPPIEIATCLGHAATEVVKLLPELATVLPDLIPSPALDPEPEKRRLFHAMAWIFSRLASEQPVLAVFEDLHWSDDTTLEFVLHLARRLRSQRLLILVTYRSDEVGAALEHLLVELDRQRLAVEISLERLTQADVDVMLRTILNLPRAVRRDFLEPIFQLTDGNPFFIEEVLSDLAMTGHGLDSSVAYDHGNVSAVRIPRTVQDAVRRRSEQISPAARRTLATAAVIGRRFDPDLLREMTRLDEEALLDAIKEAITARLVVEESAERFVFRHALTREALYSQLLARERRDLHRAIAEALERGAGDMIDARLDDLAYHFFEAQAWEKALEYARRAGERAQRLYALQSAVVHFDRALEAARHLSAPFPLGVLRLRGIVRDTLGDFDGALADQESVLRQASETGDRRSAWQALLDLGLLWSGRDYARTGDCYQRALVAAQSLDDPSALAHTLNRLGNWLLNAGRSGDALERHQQALAIFQERNDLAGLAQTLDLLGMASYLVGDLTRAVDYYRQAVDFFHKLNDHQGLVGALATMGLCAGAYQSDAVSPSPLSASEGLRCNGVAMKTAQEIGWRAGEAYCQFSRGLLLGFLGDYAAAFRAARTSLEIAQDIEHRQWTSACLCVLGALHLDVLDPLGARQQLDQALALADAIGSRWWTNNAGAFLASTLVCQRDFAAAASVLDTVLARDATATDMAQRLASCVRGELFLAQGDAERALHTAEWLISSTPAGESGRQIPRLLKLQGEAFLALGRYEPAEAALSSARAAATVRGARPSLWRIHLALGKLRRAQGRREEAQQEFSSARRIIEELALGIPGEPMRDRFLGAATALLPRSIRTSPSRGTVGEAFGGLTEREQDVAALIARGLSNRAIAEELVVGERTVETHVSSILAKLQFSVRSQIAAWAVERGLTDRGGHSGSR